MLTEDTFYSSVVELAAQIRARKLSPVELTEGYLARLERFGARLGAVATVMRESALREARQAEREIRAGRYKGVLHGIPYGAKDLLATREAPTTWGATPYKNQRFDYDATVVRKLRDAGGVCALTVVRAMSGAATNAPATVFANWRRDARVRATVAACSRLFIGGLSVGVKSSCA